MSAAVPPRRAPASPPRASRPLLVAILLSLAVPLASCSATLDSRTLGFASSPPPGPRPTAAATAAASSRAAATDPAAPPADRTAPPPASPRAATAVAAPAGTCRPQRWADPWPYLDRPADPWLAVVDGQPARTALPTDRTGHLGPATAACDAAHDHCLRDCTWLVTEPTGDASPATARAFHVDPRGAFVLAWKPTHTASPGFVAYRTVPVTRHNLRAGALVMTAGQHRRDGGGRRTLVDGHDVGRDLHALELVWQVGTVTAIDWPAGLVHLDHRPEPFHLSATRLAVLRTTADQPVEPIPGTDPRVPARADLIAPMAP